ncbi:MAG: hypothetical protein HC842_06020 [Cytophagales bacterium]|nr:hypothetical protein [Cytophagales bacterium]
MGIDGKLNYKKSFFPDITHVDFSCRVQSVRADLNPYLYSLLLRFRADTGHSILLNTSFNRANEPIVDNVSDAFSCFTETIMDVLVIGNTIVIK